MFRFNINLHQLLENFYLVVNHIFNRGKLFILVIIFPFIEANNYFALCYNKDFLHIYIIELKRPGKFKLLLYEILWKVFQNCVTKILNIDILANNIYNKILFYNLIILYLVFLVYFNNNALIAFNYPGIIHLCLIFILTMCKKLTVLLLFFQIQ